MPLRGGDFRLNNVFGRKIGQNLPRRDGILCASTEKPRQNGRTMTSFWGAMAKPGAGVDNELGGSAPNQCR